MQLRQILRNLLNNAIKFTLAGGQITCRCGVRYGDRVSAGAGQTMHPGSWVVFEVADTGIGIAASDLGPIFERFYRVRGESDVPGAGLGLSIAQELARQHGGWIGVASTPGMGSTFSVHLPLHEGQ